MNKEIYGLENDEAYVEALKHQLDEGRAEKAKADDASHAEKLRKEEEEAEALRAEAAKAAEARKAAGTAEEVDEGVHMEIKQLKKGDEETRPQVGDKVSITCAIAGIQTRKALTLHRLLCRAADRLRCAVRHYRHGHLCRGYSTRGRGLQRQTIRQLAADIRESQGQGEEAGTPQLCTGRRPRDSRLGGVCQADEPRREARSDDRAKVGLPQGRATR